MNLKDLWSNNLLSSPDLFLSLWEKKEKLSMHFKHCCAFHFISLFYLCLAVWFYFLMCVLKSLFLSLSLFVNFSVIFAYSESVYLSDSHSFFLMYFCNYVFLPVYLCLCFLFEVLLEFSVLILTGRSRAKDKRGQPRATHCVAVKWLLQKKNLI